MSRSKTGWRIVYVPFGPSRWHAVNEKQRDAKCFATYDAAYDYVWDITASQSGVWRVFEGAHGKPWMAWRGDGRKSG